MNSGRSTCDEITDLCFYKNFFTKNNSMPKKWKDRKEFKPENLYISFYSFSSLYYAIAGIIMYMFFKKNFNLLPKIPVPIEIFIGLLIFQSLTSFLADVVYINEPSYFHMIDRITAVSVISIFASNIYWISPIEKIYFVSVILLSYFVFKDSREARRNNNIDAFLSKHERWHRFFPLAIIFWLLYRLFINGYK